MKTKKSLGQHFLRSTKIIEKIVKVSSLQKGDVVLEIGPGEGVLTESLLQSDAKVVAIEKDDRLIPILKEKFAKEILSGQFKLIHEDILKLEMEKIEKPYKVIANIPYYITGQILRMFLESPYQPKSMTLLVQKEVAERIVAKDGKESLLSISVQAFGTPKLIATVGRGAFTPPPNVDSAILLINNVGKEKLDDIDEKFFFEIIRAGFAHKRKQLLPNLSNFYKKEDLLKAFEVSSMDPHVRAEDISFPAWITLCKTLYQFKRTA